jgi:hypothetical protein
VWLIYKKIEPNNLATGQRGEKQEKRIPAVVWLRAGLFNRHMANSD